MLTFHLSGSLADGRIFAFDDNGIVSVVDTARLAERCRESHGAHVAEYVYREQAGKSEIAFTPLTCQISGYSPLLALPTLSVESSAAVIQAWLKCACIERNCRHWQAVYELTENHNKYCINQSSFYKDN